MPAPHSTKITPGYVIAGRYRITREIGRGGMAYVYEAAHTGIGKRVAVKILAEEFSSSTTVVERFFREARAAAAVRSPYICDVYDTGRLEDGRPFLVMELLEGESLYERMVRVRQFDSATTVRVITHAARGLAKAHEGNIVHRDLKPENIFLTTNEDGEIQAKILDFGLAKFYSPMGTGGEQARLTREGAIFGTPAYMSPEQIKGQGAVDHRADIWALGCITYECFTGRTVWSTDQGVAMTFAQIASYPIPKLTKYRPDLPPSIEVWFQKSLSREVDKRFQTAKELAEGLSDALNQGPPSIVLGDATYAIAPQNQAPGSQRRPGVQANQPQSEEITVETESLDDLELIPVEEGSLRPPAPRTAPGGTTEPGANQPRVSSEEFGVHRPPEASLIDVGTSNTVKGSKPVYTEEQKPKNRTFLMATFTAVLIAGGLVAWQFIINSGTNKTDPNAIRSGQSVVPSAPLSNSTPMTGSANRLPKDAPEWATMVDTGQKELAKGEIGDAYKKFRKAFEISGSIAAKNLSDYTKIAMDSNSKGPCKLIGLARYRPDGFAKSSRRFRPLILNTGKGFLAFWTDDHESPNHVHAYARLLDNNLRPIGNAIDISPEADTITSFDVEFDRDRVVLVYSENKGHRAGLYIRFLDTAGRITSGPVQFSKTPNSAHSPEVALGPNSDIWVTWLEEDLKQGASDVYVRNLGKGKPSTDPVKITELHRTISHKASARAPALAVTNQGLEVVFRLEEGTARTIHHLHITYPQLQTSLAASEKLRPRRHLFLGQHQVLSTDEPGDVPSISCGKIGCFVVWHLELGNKGGGAMAAMLDHKTAQMIWKKKFAKIGGKPSLSLDSSGKGMVVWFENTLVRVAVLGREGVGQYESSLARVIGNLPRPFITPGATPGTWAVSWLDFEGGPLEPYALQAKCQP
jgi:eukaryotic-like serine/threonine-protein kinase